MNIILQKSVGTLLGVALGLASVTALAPLARAEDEHAHHRAMMAAPDAGKVKRSLVDIRVPATPMIRQDGTPVVIQQEIDKRPVIVAFIYTTCTTICPMTSQILAQTQQALRDAAGKMSIISVSIDPEHDTPQKLSEYAVKYGAGPDWQHYTGSLASSVDVQKAFGVYRGDKMNHIPVFFVRGNKSWVRLDGFPSASQLAKEFRDQTAG